MSDEVAIYVDEVDGTEARAHIYTEAELQRYIDRAVKKRLARAQRKHERELENAVRRAAREAVAFVRGEDPT